MTSLPVLTTAEDPTAENDATIDTAGATRRLRVASVNVNGIRAAFRTSGVRAGNGDGMREWLAARDVDVLTLQEVRAPDAVVHELLGPDWYVAHAEAGAKGRAGVAVATRLEPTATRIGIGEDYFATAGRWIEVDVTVPTAAGDAVLTAVSAYVHSGEAGTARQEDKYRFLTAMERRLPQIRARADLAVVTGDLNVGHTTRDIKNWKGNATKAGFLPEERAYVDRFLGEHGWVDVHRALAGDVDGPYTWWSMRGAAFDNDAGWRIDYQLATPELARTATTASVDRAASWDTRWSDHAPLVIDYQL
ncbi:exodeoxyribonuclease III [Tersicoccus solisilvae]|uniref:Exodeoxyribonuclease III n=1 Tax=Tersicoccus solisilvae TaxID=1882339 RepID=A0ABQ1P9A3_9MICC|nr:exodeoxyribonuclease III [Tersicoccus solisilvae]